MTWTHSLPRPVASTEEPHTSCRAKTKKYSLANRTGPHTATHRSLQAYIRLLPSMMLQKLERQSSLSRRKRWWKNSFLFPEMPREASRCCRQKSFSCKEFDRFFFQWRRRRLVTGNRGKPSDEAHHHRPRKSSDRRSVTTETVVNKPVEPRAYTHGPDLLMRSSSCALRLFLLLTFSTESAPTRPGSGTC